MTNIIPTEMPENEDDFREKINTVYRHVDTIQIDVMDGKFVNSTSWPYNDFGNDFWYKLKTQEEGLPQWEKVNFEVDLMVENQIEEATSWINAGVSRIIGHIEAFTSDEMVDEFIELGKNSMVEIYLALAPSTDINRIKKWIKSEVTENDFDNEKNIFNKIDGVQFMGIENVGYQGQPFAEEIIKKISELHIEFPNLIISVDGGVNDETAPELIEAGAANLASGSYIFNAADPKEAIDYLKSL
jgi:pentose-5-phosphate-3-epimerase